MGLVFGYIYDDVGKYVEMIRLYEGPIYQNIQKDNWVNYPITESVQIGYGVYDMPPNCTLEKVPSLNTDPVFKDGKWHETKVAPTLPPLPTTPSEIEEVKKQLKITQDALTEFIMQRTLKGMM